MQNKEIEEALELLQRDIQSCKDLINIRNNEDCEYLQGKIKKWNNILQYIDQLENKVKELEKENTDIKEVYIRTAKHLDKKGHLELSEYMLAQIEATPTFTTWEEYTTWVSKQVIRDKIEELKKQCGGNVFHIQQTINSEIRLLQELLEEK